MSGQPTASERAKGMLLGAAVGDALGWPQERNSGNVVRKKNGTNRPPEFAFCRWRRFSGTRWSPFYEEIEPGQYSDDTQLLCCVARSLEAGEHWWSALTETELPFWLLYERGGGASVKRAARAWTAGHPPWQKTSGYADDDVARYFQTGANGAALRIAPHCLQRESDFSTIARDILWNAISTHGHPRALLGALTFGYAVWCSFQIKETLPYGGLVESVLAGVDTWAALAEDRLPEGWCLAFEARQGPLVEAWSAAKKETIELLGQARDGLALGALASETEVLARMGCQDPRIGGAGTITAAAALFLASRYAANPNAGLLEASFLPSADTDTLAAMTGQLLGALLGDSWISPLTDETQDAGYLRSLAMSLMSPDTPARARPRSPRVTRVESEGFLKRLDQAAMKAKVTLPDGRKARLLERRKLEAPGAKLSASSNVVQTDDGQTLFFTRTSRQSTVAEGRSGFSSSPPETTTTRNRNHASNGSDPYRATPISGRIEVRLAVSDLTRAQLFYERLLGYAATRVSGSFVAFGPLMLVKGPASRASGGNLGVLVVVEVSSLNQAREAALLLGARRVQEPEERSGRRFFRCSDPDGHELQVYEAVDIGSTPEPDE